MNSIRYQWVTFRDRVQSKLAALNKGKDESLPERLFLPALFGIGLAPLPLWPFVRQATWGGIFWYTFEHASIPIFLAVAIGSRLFMPRFWATSDWFVRGLTFVIATAMLTFMAQMHVGAINQWYGESEPVVISGTVLDKLSNGEGALGVRVQTNSGIIVLRISAHEYDGTDVGDAFSKRYMRGSLGLLHADE